MPRRVGHRALHLQHRPGARDWHAVSPAVVPNTVVPHKTTVRRHFRARLTRLCTRAQCLLERRHVLRVRVLCRRRERWRELRRLLHAVGIGHRCDNWRRGPPHTLPRPAPRLRTPSPVRSNARLDGTAQWHGACARTTHINPNSDRSCGACHGRCITSASDRGHGRTSRYASVDAFAFVRCADSTRPEGLKPFPRTHT